MTKIFVLLSPICPVYNHHYNIMSSVYKIISRYRRHIKSWISCLIIVVMIVSLLDMRSINILNYGVSTNKHGDTGIVIDGRDFVMSAKGEARIQSGKADYVETIQKILVGKFVHPRSVSSPSDEFINLGMIIINLSNTTQLSEKFSSAVMKMFNSIFVYSSGAPLNLIIITDSHSLQSVSTFLGHLIMYETSKRVIVSKHWRWRRQKVMPNVRVNYVDSERIIEKNKLFVKTLKASTAQASDNKTIEEDRYTADLFYMAPIYHLAFTSLTSLLVIDSTDLDFHQDISILHNQMQEVVGGKIIGIGLDLSPNYYVQLANYRSLHPGSRLGYAGRLQGFNTGVVLYNLAAMRQSVLYNSYLTPSMIKQVAKQFMYSFTLAEQDWFTNLGFIHPHLFYILPCRFNRQTSIQFLRPPWEEIFEYFHSCQPKNQVAIFHSNGCGPTPQDCKFSPENTTTQYWQGRDKYMEDIHVDIDRFWVGIAGLD